MQTARETAMRTVNPVPKGAGQHSGPHGTPYVTNIHRREEKENCSCRRDKCVKCESLANVLSHAH